MAKKHRERYRGWFDGKYDFLTLCLVPGMTLWLASMESWFGTNLSVVCSQGGMRLGFAIWGITVGLYYGFYTFYLFRLGNYHRPAARGLVLAAAGFLITAVLIPYEPELKPEAAYLHVVLAFFAPILLIWALTLFLLFAGRRSPGIFQNAWRIMWILEAGAVVVFGLAGFINSFLELYAVSGLCGFLRYLEGLLKTETQR